jgi:Dolichyl-phosphate-mannose-protein mannosyltransferase
VDVLVVVVVVGAVAAGLYFRLWLIFHAPSTSDAAISGLIAQAAQHGHFTAFYGGQHYGGTAEPDLIALAFFLFGQSAVVAELVVVALAAVAAILTQRIASRLVSRNIALLAGALAWAAPAVTLRDSIRVYGFRGVTLACGVGLLLVAFRILEGRRGLINFAVLGFLAGIGWWSSPEIAYYLLPAVLLIGMAIFRARRLRTWWPGLVTALTAAAVGMLPWIWANVGSGLASLHSNRPERMTYFGRLNTFFEYVLPMETGLRKADSGVWIFGSDHLIALLLVVALLVVSLELCLLRGGASAVIALSTMAFPFLYALSPASWAWHDGRYGCYLVPLLALVVAIGISDLSRLLHMPSTAPFVMSGLVILATILAAVSITQAMNLHRITFTSRWGDPNAPTVSAISKLEANGVTAGYADYWVAYKLDFLSKGRLNITTTGNDIDRMPLINKTVQKSKRVAWIFVPPYEQNIDGTQFSAPPLIVGPGSVRESTFVQTLDHLGVGYRVVNAGVLVAITPDRPLTPYQAGMPGVPPDPSTTTG